SWPWRGGPPSRSPMPRASRFPTSRRQELREMTAPVTEGHPTGIEPIVRDAFYIGGEWVSATDRETVDVVDATTEEVVGTVALGTAEDLDGAVRAARAGFAAWSQTSVEQRIDALRAITAGLQERAEEIAALVAR